MSFLQATVSGIISALVVGLIVVFVQRMLSHTRETIVSFCDRFEMAIAKLDRTIETIFNKVAEEATKREDMNQRLSKLEGAHATRIEIGIGCHHDDRD